MTGSDDEAPLSARSVLDLMDWKRTIFEVYAEARRAEDPRGAWELWRAVRENLFHFHPQSPLPLPARERFGGLPYFDYDPGARVMADVAESQPVSFDIATSGTPGGTYRFTRFAVARFSLEDEPLSLEVFWLEGYGGGVFVPFRDATSGKETYGAGRYLLDTVKGADLGMDGERMVLDFNFAYNPSCAYDPRWVCPLAPPGNRLGVPVRAGERLAGRAPT